MSSLTRHVILPTLDVTWVVLIFRLGLKHRIPIPAEKICRNWHFLAPSDNDLAPKAPSDKAN